MEAVVSEKRGGSMKSKLIMSFYRTPKPPPATMVKTTSLRCDAGKSGNGFDGGGGDLLVDKKASSFISQVKERRRIEESNLMIDGKNCAT